MTLHSAPGRRSRQPHRHHRSAGPVLDPNRRCLAARSRRPARPKAGARWEQRSDPHRGNRYHVCDRLEGPLSHRRTGLHIFRSRYRPDHHHPRLPHRQARPDGLTEKFQIFLASTWPESSLQSFGRPAISRRGRHAMADQRFQFASQAGRPSRLVRITARGACFVAPAGLPSADRRSFGRDASPAGVWAAIVAAASRTPPGAGHYR